MLPFSEGPDQPNERDEMTRIDPHVKQRVSQGTMRIGEQTTVATVEDRVTTLQIDLWHDALASPDGRLTAVGSA